MADALTIPVVVYNAPGFTGMEISPNALGIISRHPNIIGMKDSSPYKYSRYLEVCDTNFQLLSGSIQFWMNYLRQQGNFDQESAFSFRMSKR